MKALRFFLKSIFTASIVFILAFFVFLFGGGRLVEMLSNGDFRKTVFHVLTLGMPFAILGTLAETITRRQDRSARLRKALVTFVLALCFAAAAYFVGSF